VNCFGSEAFDEEKLDYESLLEPIDLLPLDVILAEFNSV
jgi:hypothetical protein